MAWSSSSTCGVCNTSIWNNAHKTLTNWILLCTKAATGTYLLSSEEKVKKKFSNSVPPAAAGQGKNSFFLENTSKRKKFSKVKQNMLYISMKNLLKKEMLCHGKMPINLW